MKIGLVSVDGHNFPNLALMKLSAWHKQQGDIVEWASPILDDYDRVYMSKVFTFTPDCLDIYHCDVVRGGTGYKDYDTVLPDNVEHICPDYSLYGNTTTAYGFLTRGCVNKCPWCVVPNKEGYIRPNADIDEFIDNRKEAVLLDNNVLASRRLQPRVGCPHNRKESGHCPPPLESEMVEVYPNGIRQQCRRILRNECYIPAPPERHSVFKDVFLRANWQRYG